MCVHETHTHSHTHTVTHTHAPDAHMSARSAAKKRLKEVLSRHERIGSVSDGKVVAMPEIYAGYVRWWAKDVQPTWTRVYTRSYSVRESVDKELKALRETLLRGGTPEKHRESYVPEDDGGENFCDYDDHADEESEEENEESEEESDEESEEENAEDAPEMEEWEKAFEYAGIPHLEYIELYSDFDEVTGELVVCNTNKTRKAPRELRRKMTSFEERMHARWLADRHRNDATECEVSSARREVSEAYPDATELFERGYINEIYRIRFASAKMLYAMAARGGNLEAIYRLGLMWYTLKGAKANDIAGHQKSEDASKFFRVAAERNHPGAMFFLAKDQERSDVEMEEVDKLYRRSSDRGFQPACYHLAKLLWNTERQEAVQLLRRAAKKGHVGAMDLLGTKTLSGDGVPQDPRRGHELLKMAAERSDRAKLIVQVALQLKSGVGCRADLGQARRFLERAVALGSQDARMELEKMAAEAAVSLMAEEAAEAAATKDSKPKKKKKKKASMAVEEKEKIEEEEGDDAVEEADEVEEDKGVDEVVKVSLEEFCCPISLQLMSDPVVAADGFSYERDSIERWLEKHETSPSTGATLPHKGIVPNHQLKAMIAGLSGV